MTWEAFIQPKPRTDRWTWATVTQASPLLIRIDGEDTALDITPDTLVSGLAVSDRVYVQFTGTYAIVHSVAGGGEYVPWTALPLDNSWIDFGGVHQTARYRKDGNRVEVQGLIKDGTTTASTSVATLPVGCRPGADLLMSSLNNDAYMPMTIKSGGGIQLRIAASTAFLAINFTFTTD